MSTPAIRTTFSWNPCRSSCSISRIKRTSSGKSSILKNSTTLSPLNTERKMEIAKIYLDTGNESDAKKAFESVMKLTAKSVNDIISETASKIGKMYAQHNNPEAEAYLRKAIEVYGDNLEKSHMHLFNNLGILLRRKGKWKDAVRRNIMIGLDD